MEENRTLAPLPQKELQGKDVEMLRDFCGTMLDAFNKLSIDRMNHQHTLIKNYLWLSASFVIVYGAMFNELATKHHFSVWGTGFVALAIFIAAGLAIASLAIGVFSMSGANFGDPLGKGAADLESVFPGGQLDLQKCRELYTTRMKNIDQSMEEAFGSYSKRLSRIRWLNRLLLCSLGFGTFAGALFFFLALKETL